MTVRNISDYIFVSIRIISWLTHALLRVSIATIF